MQECRKFERVSSTTVTERMTQCKQLTLWFEVISEAIIYTELLMYSFICLVSAVGYRWRHFWYAANWSSVGDQRDDCSRMGCHLHRPAQSPAQSQGLWASFQHSLLRPELVLIALWLTSCCLFTQQATFKRGKVRGGEYFCMAPYIEPLEEWDCIFDTVPKPSNEFVNFLKNCDILFHFIYLFICSHL